MREEKQALAFMAGANAVFTGEKMLTTACNGWDEDREMFERWGLRAMKPHEPMQGKQEANLEEIGGEVFEFPAQVAAEAKA